MKETASKSVHPLKSDDKETTMPQVDIDVKLMSIARLYLRRVLKMNTETYVPYIFL